MSWLTLLVIALGLLGSTCSEQIPFDEVAPFATDTNTTSMINILALKFQPQLYISSGCFPYPAVDAKGRTSAGLLIFKVAIGCHGSPLGSQVYGRAAELNGYLGIMFTWYFPRDFPIPTLYMGHHHAWEHVFVWLSSRSEDAKLLSVTVPSVGFFYSSYSLPKEKQMDGNHVKLKYTSWLLQTPHYLKPTRKAGTYQDLIMWDNMTDAAREALEQTNFFFHKAPISTSKFERYLQQAYPF
ncbi:hypothetical protein DD237_007315 [Peronospora effusa]|uniref:Uncharacterized protein n=1 Tax=Peronospora effusa TaxID=542832 RepID=A0A425C076_9STRA|nr:hypothetical protein DD237_007315 [Peronospora effusa]